MKKVASSSSLFTGIRWKLLRSLFYCFLGAFATWILNVTNVVDFGMYTPFVGALAPLIANTIIQFIKETK